jgi:homogentisate 1,2-dioxygenase
VSFYRTQGFVPPKRHTQHRLPGGELAFEELMGEEGFSSDSSLLYHRNLPSRIVAAEPWPLTGLQTRPNHP